MLARRSRVLVLFALVGFLSGCGNMTHAKEYAETAIGKFHSELNSAAFGAIYDDTDDNFRKATTRAPAALPARIPAGASSKTTHSCAGTAKIRAPFR